MHSFDVCWHITDRNLGNLYASFLFDVIIENSRDVELLGVGNRGQHCANQIAKHFLFGQVPDLLG